MDKFPSRKAKITTTTTTTRITDTVTIRKNNSSSKALNKKSKNKKPVKTGKSKRGTKADASRLFSQFSICLTGCTAGDILEEIKGNGMLQVHYRDIPSINLGNDEITLRECKTKIFSPCQLRLDVLRSYPEIWKQFLSKLRQIDRFAALTTFDAIERELDLIQDCYPNHRNVCSGGNLVLSVIVPPDQFTTGNRALDDEALHRLVSQNENSVDGFWTVEEIIGMMPPLPGAGSTSKVATGTHTLALRRGVWRIKSLQVVPRNHFKGIIINISRGKLGKKISKKSNGDRIIVANDLGFYMNNMFASQNEKKFPSIDEWFKEFKLKEDPALLDVACKNVGTRELKSIMQKLIRLKPSACKTFVDGKTFSTKSCLIYCVLRLLDPDQPGQFMPDLGKFVTAFVSVCKRLAVISYEDSFPVPKEAFQLLSAALLAERMPSWRPQLDFLKNIVNIAVRLLNEDRACNYNSKDKSLKPIILDSSVSLRSHAASAMLDMMHPLYGSDAIMLRDVAYKNSGNKFLPEFAECKTKSIVMPFPDHAMDQHVFLGATAMSYFVSHYLRRHSPNALKRLLEGVTYSAPFQKLLAHVFNKVTAYNPRREKNQFNEKDTFVKSVRFAQRNLCKMLDRTDGSGKDQTAICQKLEHYIIPNDYVTALIGVIDIGGKPPMIATVNPSNILSVVAIRRPARGVNESQLHDEKLQESAKKRAKAILAKGVPLNAAKALHPSLENCKAFLELDDDENAIEWKIKYPNGEVKSWEDARKVQFEFKVLKACEPTLENAIKFRENKLAIQENAKERFITFLKDYSNEEILRAMSLITHCRPSFRMPLVSQMGGFLERAVTKVDAAAFDILSAVTVIYPAALQYAARPFDFNVPCLPLIQRVREILRQHTLNYNANSNVTQVIPPLKDSRILKEHQEEAISEMQIAHNAGVKGHFIWATVGMGKTLIAAKFIDYLRREKEMPPYIIWALPRSAIAGVVIELREKIGWPVEWIIPVKAKGEELEKKMESIGVKIKRPSPILTISAAVITIIEHDHLRHKNTREVLIQNASNSILVFDEVHKAFNRLTQRTGIALEIARLSRGFIALTGTPIVDSTAYSLMWWLEQIVNFEVNRKNFWVAANAMISKLVATGVHVKRQEMEVAMDVDELAEYRKLVPYRLGGTNGGRVNFVQAANHAYTICEVAMVKKTKGLLAEGVMLVAKDTNSQVRLAKMLVNEGVAAKDIFCLGSNNKSLPSGIANGSSIFLTSDQIKEKKVKNFKVVIVPQRQCEGYSLTALRHSITCVYPSNQATRDQLEGRINRISQKATEVCYWIFHTGLLSYIYEHHRKARNLRIALESMAKEFELD